MANELINDTGYHDGKIYIHDTRFMYNTNFSGDPKRDINGDARRKANIIIPFEDLAHDMIDDGIGGVRPTKPRMGDDPETFKPTWFVPVLAGFRNKKGEPVKYPPEIYLRSGDEEVLLTEENVGIIDRKRIKKVDVILNRRVWDDATGKKTLYIDVMYVYEDKRYDPFAAEFFRRDKDVEDGDPF